MKMIINATKYDTDTAERLAKRRGALDFEKEHEVTPNDIFDLDDTAVECLAFEGYRVYRHGGAVTQAFLAFGAENVVGRTASMMITEELFRKRNGSFFLAAKCNVKLEDEAGGVRVEMMDDYVAMIPLRGDEAREWAERYLSVEKYEEIFGPVAE